MRRLVAFAIAALIGGACATPAGHLQAGDAALAARDYPRAAQSYRAALSALPDEPAFDDERLGPLSGLGTTAGDPAEAALAYQKAVAILERQNAPRTVRADMMMGFGARLRQNGRCDEARAVLEDAIALYRASTQAPTPGLVLNLGNVHFDCGDLLEARRAYRTVLSRSSESWMRASALRGLASVDIVEGSLKEARIEVAEALAQNERHAGLDHPDLVRVLDVQACILRLSGRGDEAAAATARADAIVRANPSWFQHARSRSPSPRLASSCSGPAQTSRFLRAPSHTMPEPSSTTAAGSGTSVRRKSTTP